MNPFGQATGEVEGWFGRHRHTSAAPAAVTVNTGETMPLADTLRTVATEIETVGDDVLGWTKVIAANPLTAPALEWLATLAGINIDPAVLVKGLGAIEALRIAYTPAVQQQADVEAGQQQVTGAPAQQ